MHVIVMEIWRDAMKIHSNLTSMLLKLPHRSLSRPPSLPRPEGVRSSQRKENVSRTGNPFECDDRMEMLESRQWKFYNTPSRKSAYIYIYERRVNIHKVFAYIVYPTHCNGKNSAAVA